VENKLKKKWHNYINTDGIKVAERNRQDMSLATMIVIAVVVFSSLLISNYDTYSTLLFSSLLGVLIFILISAALFYLTPFQQAGRLVLCGGVLGFNGCLIYTGGAENTALYWVLYYPLICYSITGHRWGSFFSAAFVVMCIVMLFGPDLLLAEYREVEKKRFLFSSLVIIIFSFINEYYRFRSQSSIETVSLDTTRDANTDVLTDIPNRRFLESSYFPYLRSNGEYLLPAAFIMTDIDRFKLINDSYGHDVGDKAIVHAVNVIKKTLRNTDVLCRVGGEEFLICIPQMPLSRAVQLAEKIRTTMESTPLVLEDGTSIAVRSSFGVSLLESVDDFNAAIKLADDRLYKAKETGRNKVVSD
jgi:two-component system, cell cycle response regulator